MYYILILAFQVYCIYHCYTQKNTNYWYLIIVLLPVVGGFVYLYKYGVPQNGEEAQQKDNTVANPKNKIADLEEKLEFSGSFDNKVALADAFLEQKMYAKAIAQYKTSLINMFKNDFYVLSKIQECYYSSSDYKSSIEYAERILEMPGYKKSKAPFLYGMALDKEGYIEKAEKVLAAYNAPYSKYHERLELAKFYIRNNKLSASKEVLQDIITESETMSKPGYKTNLAIFTKAKELIVTA